MSKAVFSAYGHVFLSCCALISLTPVSAGSGLGALVSQQPRRAVSKSGASVTIECRAVDFQASSMFWYRQFPKRGLVLMATSNAGTNATYEQGYNKDKFPLSHPDITFSSLMVTSVDPADSGLYFCGARDTALGRDQRPRQESW